MTTYSLSGYLAALQIRGVRSILLEGQTDIMVISRVVAELEATGRLQDGGVTIDPIEIISDPEISAGNREAVEFVHAQATAEELPLAALVDREFRDFSTAEDLRDNLGCHFRDGTLWWTRGHSIENYFFEPVVLRAYLTMKFPETVSSECLVTVEEQLPNILKIAAAVSLAARNAGVLGRTAGACQQRTWSYSPEDGIEFKIDIYLESLAARGVTGDALSLFSKSLNQYLRRINESPDQNLARWLVHGHLGWNFVWTGIGRLLHACGGSPDVIESVSRGFFEEKIRFAADKWGVCA